MYIRSQKQHGNRQRENRLKKMAIGLAILVLVTVFFANSKPIFATNKYPEVLCEAAILVDNKTGKILFEKNSQEQMMPASITKIMTCILVLENLDMKKEVSIPTEASNIQGNNMELKEGEILTVQQLVYAMMVYSANDAAIALAIEVSGSEKEFVDMMNTRAVEMGAEHTHFLNCSGLTEDPAHTTTAVDLISMTRECLKNQEFRKIIGTDEITIPETNKSKSRRLVSTNRILYDKKSEIVVNGQVRTPKYKGAFGIKTGMMLNAGYCLVTGAEREGTELLAVTLKNKKALDRFADGITMLDYGFENFHTVEIVAPGSSCGKVKVKYGHKTRVETYVENGAYLTLPKEGMDSIARHEIKLDKNIKAPIKKGEKVGIVQLYESDKKVGHVDILIKESVKKGGPWAALYISDMTIYISLGGLVFLLMALCILHRRKKRLIKKREEKKRKAREAKARQIAIEREEKRRREWPY